jgi:L-threonylcarbamoyladenylate synthase
MNKTRIRDGFDVEAVREAVALMDEGKPVAFPTETVYGLGADAFNPIAVARIFELKKRPHFDPLIVHIADQGWVARLTSSIPDKAKVLMDRFWPGPLTIILEKRDSVPDIVTAGLSTVGIRMPRHQVAQSLLNHLGRPIAAPSANPFGYMSTTSASDVASLFDGALPLVLDGGVSTYGIESTIVSIVDGHIRLHRHGSVPIEELTSVVGPVLEKAQSDGSCESPGELPYHYAPHTPLRIVCSPQEIVKEESCFLAFAEPRGPVRSRHVRVLSPGGDLREAAGRFFSALIALDREGMDVIYAEKVPDRGVGRAIMERLRKAARKTGG